MTTTTEELPVSTEYLETSLRFRHVWLDYLDKREEAKNEIVNMLKILLDEGYSKTKAIQKIMEDHKDLKGFSKSTIYRELPDTMKQSNSLRDLKQYNSEQDEDVTNKDYGFSNEKQEGINSTSGTSDDKNANQTTEDGEPSLLVVDLPPPEPELRDPKILNFVGQLPKPVLRLAEKIELSPTKIK